MFLQVDINLFDAVQRERLARLIASTIAGDACAGQERPGESSPEREVWSVSSENLWTVTFFKEKRHVFQLKHRYQSSTKPHEEALASWLAFRIGAVRLPDLRVPPSGSISHVRTDYAMTLAGVGGDRRYCQRVRYTQDDGTVRSDCVYGATELEARGIALAYSESALKGELFYARHNGEYKVFALSEINQGAVK